MAVRFQIDPKSGVPFYRQIIEQVKFAIARGRLRPGEQLPTVRQLAVDLFSVREARPVWHGTTATRVTRSDREDPDELIREALEAILGEFPPG